MTKLKFGDIVWHDDYGLGFVIQVNGFENDLTYSVMFENRVICGKDIKLTKVTDWIPCSERMPELDVPVLVHTGSGMRIDKAYDFGDGVSFYEDLYGDVTHWMPLPDMPEKEEI